MISILLPTRKRPKQLERLVNSLRETSSILPEVVVYIDDDDQETICKANELNLKLVIGSRADCFTDTWSLSDMWNKCYYHSTGDIVVTCGDDVVFLTPNWDVIVEACFAEYPDRIVMVHGSVLFEGNVWSNNNHPILHRRSVEAVGYFSPPYPPFTGNDFWWRDVFTYLNRVRHLPFIMDHLHYTVDKSEFDETYKESMKRSPFIDAMAKYYQMSYERLEDTAKLQAVIDQYSMENSNDLSFASNA